MIHLPIEQRYDKRSQVFHSSAFAIAAGVVGVAGAATSAAVSMSAADKAAKGQAAAGRKLEKQTKRATQQYIGRAESATQEYRDQLGAETENFTAQQEELKKLVKAINPNINIPDYNIENATLSGIRAANQMTANTINQLEKITGRNPTEVIQKAMNTLGDWESNLRQQYVQIQQGVPLIQQQEATISSMMRGELPQVALEQISRATAERAGAGFSMQAAGRTPFIQSPQAMIAENIRQTSEERMRAGLALAPQVTAQRTALAGMTTSLAGAAGGLSNVMGNWTNIAQGFITGAQVPMAFELTGRAQDIGKKQAGIENQFRQLGMIADINAGVFGSRTGALGNVYNAQQRLAEGIYNAMTGQAQQAYGVQQANLETALARDQATAQGIQGVSSAAAGALGGIGSAYGQLASAQNVNFGGQTYGATKGFGGQTYLPQTTSSGALFYSPKSGSIY